MSRHRGTGSIYRQPGCKTWTIKYYRNGRPVREATGLPDYQAARQKLNQRLNQVTEGTFISPKMERTTVQALAEYFLRDYRINGRRSYGHAETRWRKHLQPFFGTMRAADASSAVIAQYVDARLQQGAQSATINRELAALKRMFRLGYYSTPPMVLRLPAFPRLQEDNTRTGFVEGSQYATLAGAASELWLRALIEVAHTYGWRKQELLGLRVRQIDLAARTIRLDPGTTKNRDGREVTMTPNIYALLAQCVHGKGPEGHVLTRPDGKPIRDFRKAWRNACISSGLGAMVCRTCSREVKGEKCDDCHSDAVEYVGLIFHDLRRTAARNLRRAGVAEGVIMRVGGWRTRSVFERYNIVSQADISEALRKLELYERDQATPENGHDFGHDASRTQPEVKREAVN